MSTTLADILDALERELTPSSGRADPADADRAVAVLGRSMQRLADDGLATTLGTDRERWVREAARSSLDSVDPNASTTIGRLSRLATAADETIAVMRGDLGSQQRWAIATAVGDALGPLAAIAAHGDITDDRRRALVGADASAMVVQRFAALDPPPSTDCAPLDWAVPNPSAVPRATSAATITEAAAGLEHSTRSLAGAVSLADYLSVGIAIEELSRAAGSLPGAGRGIGNAAVAAGQGWAASRAVLNLFDDGSRRPHSDAPPVVSHALDLHHALKTASRQLDGSSQERTPALVADSINEALQRVPAIAQHMQATLKDWGAEGTLLAFARDLTLREDRIAEHLRGYNPHGLVRADTADLAPARTALLTAKILSVELAARTAAASSGGPAVPNLAAANLSTRAQLTADQIHWAATHAQTTLRDHAGPPRATVATRR